MSPRYLHARELALVLFRGIASRLGECFPAQPAEEVLGHFRQGCSFAPAFSTCHPPQRVVLATSPSDLTSLVFGGAEQEPVTAG